MSWHLQSRGIGFRRILRCRVQQALPKLLPGEQGGENLKSSSTGSSGLLVKKKKTPPRKRTDVIDDNERSIVMMLSLVERVHH